MKNIIFFTLILALLDSCYKNNTPQFKINGRSMAISSRGNNTYIGIYDSTKMYFSVYKDTSLYYTYEYDSITYKDGYVAIPNSKNLNGTYISDISDTFSFSNFNF